MPVILPKEAEAYVEAEVAAGHVDSTDDVILEALNLYRSRKAYIDAQLDEGLDDMEAGRSRPFDANMLEDIKRQALEMMT